jgi:hypothetical protein
MEEQMLREDKKSGFFHYRVCIFWRRHYFTGTGVDRVPFKLREIDRLERIQETQPVSVGANDSRTWWWFEDRFYWEDEGYDSGDVLALVRDRQRKKRRQLQRAKDLLVADQVKGSHREPIPRDVRRAVFTRDGGSCAECGSNFDLQYDHILPVTLGGATTVENLQILCADCNRRKSDSI